MLTCKYLGMEAIFDLGEIEDTEKEEKNINKILEIPSEVSLIPKVGLYLGLDISESSTGVCLYENGEKVSANITLETKDGEYLEVRQRRELKECLLEVVEGKEFDLIIIEDAFQGINPKVTRLLYALNTAIDELILDDICKCKKFIRVNNQQWKSWLFTVDTENKFGKLNDKKRIEECLKLLGVYEDGSKGYQDRLDSCGLILGYFLCKDTIDKQEYVKTFKKVSISDIDYSYQEDIELVKIEAGYGTRDITSILIDDKRISKKLILQKLTELPNVIFITRNRLNLGIFGDELGLPIISGGGYFGFWVKENKIKKYMDLEDFDERLKKL